MHVQLTSKALAPALIPLTTFPNKNDICAKDLSRKEKKIYTKTYTSMQYWSKIMDSYIDLE